MTIHQRIWLTVGAVVALCGCGRDWAAVQPTKSNACRFVVEEYCERDLRLDLATQLGTEEGRDACLEQISDLCSAENFPASRCILPAAGAGRTDTDLECLELLNDEMRFDIGARELVDQHVGRGCNLCRDDVGFALPGTSGDS